MASFLSGTTQSLVECQICHIFMHLNVMEYHLASRHARATVSDSISEKSESISSEPTVQQKMNCPICNNPISTQRKKYIEHMKKHTKITCGLCFIIVTLDGFSSHIEKCRKSNATDICPICNVQLNAVKKPNKHFKGHISNVTCPFPKCPQSIAFKSFEPHLDKHYDQLISEHGSKTKNPYSGCSTPKTPNSSRNSPPALFQDTDIHNGIKCSLCAVLLTDKLDVKQHISTHIQHQCPVCQTSNLNESQIESHLADCLTNQPNPLQCPQCTRKDNSSRSLVRHIHHSHCSNLIKCDGCYNTIPCFTIRSHPTQCFKRNLPKLTGKQKQLLQANNINCLICKKQCKKTQISSHFLSHAIYQCPCCSLLIDKVAEFAPHIGSCLSNMASSRTKYTCPVCYKNFSKSHFGEHVLTEHSHLCPICEIVMSKSEFTFHGLLCTVIHNDFSIPAKDTTKENLSTHGKPAKQPFSSTSLPASKFSCPFCHSLETDNIDQIRSHLQSCVKIASNSNLQVVNLPDLVGLRIN